MKGRGVGPGGRRRYNKISWTSTDRVGMTIIAKVTMYGLASKSWESEDIAEPSMGGIRVMFVKVYIFE
jgi:hypothetical protein